MPKYDPPQPTTADAGAAYVRAMIQAVPVVGSSAMEILSVAISSPLERRRDEWMRLVGAGLEAVEVTIAELGKREAFIDTLLVATTAALRTSSEEKRRALRNAVISSATRTDPDQDERLTFLQVIDRFTATHLRMLQVLIDPVASSDGRYQPSVHSNVAAFVGVVLPELKGRQDFADLVWGDLVQAGLVGGTGGFHSIAGESHWEAPRVSEMGRRFLRFIDDPDPK